MKYSVLAVCFVAMFAVAACESSALQVQAIDLSNITALIQSMVATVVDTITEYVILPAMEVITEYVILPAMEVVATVQENFIAPITNKVNSAALGIAVNQFCSIVVNKAFAATAPTLDAATVIAKCQLAAEEEIRKGFDATWPN